MNIFSETEGLEGEDLITAILRVLLLRSQEVRERFVTLLSEESHLGPIELQSHFSCLLQRTTEDKSSKVSRHGQDMRGRPGSPSPAAGASPPSSRHCTSF